MGQHYPLQGGLLTGAETHALIQENLKSEAGPEAISICSAYVKRPVFEDFVAKAGGRPCRVLARFRKSDILSGASDLDVYRTIVDSGWELYMNPLFHGKVYHIPTKGIIVGSSNATVSGFSFFGKGNIEVSTLIPESKSSVEVVDNLFRSSIKITNDLYDRLHADIALQSGASLDPVEDWNIDLSQFAPLNSTELFVSDFFTSNPLDFEPFSQMSAVDLSLLGLHGDHFRHEDISHALKRTACYQWLIATLPVVGSLYFGELSSKLHSMLVDDPQPFRRTVKQLLANLLGWVAVYASDEIAIDRPNYSQRIARV